VKIHGMVRRATAFQLYASHAKSAMRLLAVGWSRLPVAYRRQGGKTSTTRRLTRSSRRWHQLVKG
jgi:hypothetical protein